ncbi:hypothetical protein VNI00_008708 [Paramarasmius palmivorus]|uniref:F-box domain-containing protein n=1 Tax=Paramarasmius palmivorus TaxID=297713 RepID=A0AAW0CW06_9AGAR
MATGIIPRLCERCNSRLDKDEDLEASRSKYTKTITSILHTNDAPSLDDIDSMRYSLLLHESAVRDVEADIARTKDYLQQLETEKEELDNYIKNQRTVLHPIRRLPREILSHVFAMCMDYTPLTTDTTLEDSVASERTEWALSRVCSQWRSVALGLSSELWSKVHIKLDKQSSKFGGHTMLLGLRLRRSCDKPLSVFIERGSFKGPGDHSLFSSLLLYSDRWSALRLDMELSELQALTSKVEPHLSALETLIFRLPITDADTDTDDPDSDDDEEREAHDDIEDPLRVPLPYYNLTDLSLDIAGSSFTISQFLALLRKATKLEELYVGYNFYEEENPDDLGLPVCLPSLHTFSMRWDISHTTTEEVLHGGDQLLDQLILPCLDNFWDGGDRSTAGSVSLDSITSLCKRSGCALTVLRITVDDIDEEIVSFLTSHYTLNSVYIMKVDGSFTEVLIRALSVPEGESGCLLPQLEDLTLQGSMTFDAALLVEMALSRRKMPETESSEVLLLSRLELDCDSKEVPSNIDAFVRFSTDEYFESLNWTFSA